MPGLHLRSTRRSLLALGAATAIVGGAAAYKKVAAQRAADHAEEESDADQDLGWGSLDVPPPQSVLTPDGAELALWDVGSGPTVVLPHCWSCTHAVWIPVARRLVASGHRVVLYDQRGHGASTRGVASLSIETLGSDLAAVLEDRDAHDAVLAGHSMGGMTIMSLATYRPKVLAERARGLVLIATAAADLRSGAIGMERFASGLIASPAVSLALRSGSGNRFVRGAFGTNPVRGHMDLTRTLFAETVPHVRSGLLTSMISVNLLEGIATIGIPTTVMVGTKDRFTALVRSEQIVAAIAGARLVTLPGRGHMLPLEDPDAVTAAIEAVGRT